ncbi:ATP-binding protein [Cystobacter fuscus]
MRGGVGLRAARAGGEQPGGQRAGAHAARHARAGAVPGGGAGWRVLEISNRGTPIPSHLLDTLFDPFRQAGPARTGRGSGLGLGLYIVQQLVLAHQGTVSVSSTAEDGTTFTVRLPRDSQDAPAAAPEAPQEMGAPAFQLRSQECPTE